MCEPECTIASPLDTLCMLRHQPRVPTRGTCRSTPNSKVSYFFLSQAVGDRLVSIIRRANPNRIFAPSGIDNHADHRAIAAALCEALRKSQVRVAVYSYPVWFWFPRFLIRAFASGQFLRL